MSKIELQVDEIHKALVGDEYRKGLVSEVDKLKSRLFYHELAISVATVVSVLFGYFMNSK